MKFISGTMIAMMAAVSLFAFPQRSAADDAKADIRSALTTAAAQKKNVIVVFGAGWCGDCKALRAAMTEGKSAPLIKKDFMVVHVDVGQFDKNEDVAASYGVPLTKGIPAVAILSPNNAVLYVTQGGELSNAGYMGEDGIYKFLKKVTDDALAKKK